MDSLTKPKIDEGVLASICAKHFGQRPSLATELTDGWFNAAFMILLADGREFVLKVAPPPDVKVLRYEEDILRAEVEVMRLLKENSRLPIPEIVAHDASFQEVGSPYFLMPKLTGKPYNYVRELVDEVTAFEIQRQIGSALRTMHGFVGTGFGVFNRPVHPTWQEAFVAMLEDLRKDSVDLKAELPAGTFEAANPFLDSLRQVTAPSLVHWDLWDGNVFVQAGSVTGLTDFERSLWGDPLIEINFQDPKPGLLEGFGYDPRTEPAAKERRMLYDLYFYLIMIVESRSRGYTSEHEQWPRARLAELMQTMR
jgi:aminoglycoside phosphotransferase (APT) family kinase protein